MNNKNNTEFNYVWFWKRKLGSRKGHKCRIVTVGKMNNVLVEFESDGYKVVTSRWAVRKADEIDKNNQTREVKK